jgi:hypothetical protein
VTVAPGDPAFVAFASGFDPVLGDDPKPRLVAEVDAREGPVYSADEDALYFTTLPLPGVDRSPSVEADRRELPASPLLAHDRPSFQVWAVLLAANGA